MGWLILGFALLVVAGILYAVSQSSKHRSLTLAVTDLTTVGELRSLYDKVAAEAGKGAFSQRVALQGTIQCDQPLQSEVSNTPCVAYRQRLERRYEEDYEERDGEGNMVRRTREGTETVSSNDRSCLFVVRDDSGQIEVVPDGAKLETETTVDRFEPASTAGQGGILQLGPFQLNVREFGASGRRTIGYHVHEEVVPLGRTIYVLGSANDLGGALRISKPQERHEPFLISLHDREHLLHSARQTTAQTLYGAIGCGALGALLLLVGLLTRK